MSHQILIVGAGFSGSVIARLLAEAGFYIQVIDQKSHVAGHAFDYVNDLGLRVHQYGPHIFHTSNQKVVEFLSRFTEWIGYQHRVKALLADGRLVTLPVNLETKTIVGEDKVIDTFFRPYTKKMWGLDIEELDPSILSRVPIRDDDNELYFPNDTFQAMPKDGYTTLVERILDHDNIRVSLNTAFEPKMAADFHHTFNSMPIDEYFESDLGELPYRSIKFHTVNVPVPRNFPVATVNFTHDGPYTRVTEWKNFPNHGSHAYATTLTFEEPCDYKDNNYQRYYPVKDISKANWALYKRYKERVPSHMTFIGRCGMYVYLDMHQAISSSMTVAQEFLTKHEGEVRGQKSYKAAEKFSAKKVKA